MRRTITASILLASAMFAATSPAAAEDLWQVCRHLRECRLVDLTHAFDRDIPYWPGFEPMKVDTLYWYEEGKAEKGHGFFAERFTHVGQYGTHCDPPAHFSEGKRTIDEIQPWEMILPLVVIDCSSKAAENPDYVLSIEDLKAWETEHGVIPESSFVAMRTDWSHRWPDPETMANRDTDGVAHYPGWSLEALQYLYEERGITASGHEPTDTDPGVSTSAGSYAAEAYILGMDHYQIELLTNLDKVPATGAIVLVTFPKPRGGSGFPARVIAIVPRD
jgi:kynurenine formamidase